MAIVYSYEQATQPAFGDLLLGTDVSASGKPTKSFSIQSIVDLVQTGVPGGGTVTSIGTNSSTFVTMSGGPITTSGIVSASLSATGTPSATTYLRGDNTWATIGASANTTYTVTSAQNGSAANIRLTGSDSSQTIVTLAAGPNVVLTDNGTNRITIGLTGLATGSVTSVTTGAGLSIISGTATINPVIAVDYLGLNNYIKINESQATPTSADVIPFDQVSSTNVKTTNLGAIPITALTSVKSYVDAGDVGDIRNDTDTFTTTAAVNNVVSLTSAEYTALATKNANTLYIIVGAAASFTTTLAFTNNIVGTEYTINGDQAGATKSGVAGASYAYNTTLTPNAGFFFSSGPTVTNATGTFSVDETVNTILAGTVQAVAVDDVIATLAVSTSGVSGTEFTLGGNISGATITGASPLSYAFNTTISPNAGFEFVTPPTINNASGTITTSQTVVTTITGELQAVAPPPVAVTGLLNLDNLTGISGQVNGSVSPGSFSGDSPVAYSFTPSATANPGYIIENLSFTGDISGSATSSKTAVMYANGNVIEEEIGAVVELIVSNQITGGAEGTAYAVTGNQTGNQQSGPVPFVYGFSTNVTANSGYEFTSLNITNASGTTNQTGLQYVTTTITGNVQAALEPVCATLNVVKNITGEQVYSITGNDTGAQQCGLPPFDYSFTTGVSIPAGYEWTTGPTISPNPNSGTISTNTTVNTTISGIIAASIVEGTVNLAFSNNVNGSENTTTALGASTSITGPVGDPYTFTNSISANSGYEFTIAPSWDPTAVITGTIASGTTNLTQSVTGTVTAIPVQLTSFTTNASPEVSGESACSASLGTTRYHDGASTYLEINDTVYLTNSTGGGKLGAGYWGLANSTYFQTNSSGVVIDVQLCPAGPVNGTVNVNFTNSVSGKANTTTIIADGGTASDTGPVGTSYSITNSISANNGYEFTVPASWSTGGTGTVTGTFVSGTTNINQNVTGTVEAVPGDCIEYSIFANSGVVFSVSYINCDGNPSSINVPGGDEAPICSTVFPTVTAGSGTITPTGLDNCSPLEQYTVTLAFSNNVTNNQFTTTSLTPAATITGNPGDSYQFVHTITTDPGYEFTSGPTWVDNVSNNGTGTINGTIPNSNTTITQSVSGVVESALTSFLTNASPEVSPESACAAGKGATRYHTGSGTYPTDGDTLYQSNNLGSPMGAGYWGLVNGTYVVTNSSSVVTESGLCI